MSGRDCRRHPWGSAALDAASIWLPHTFPEYTSASRRNAGRGDVVEDRMGLEAAASGTIDCQVGESRAPGPLAW